MNTEQLDKLLQDRIKPLHCTDAKESLLTYLSLLQKWNHAYNLTAIRDLESMMSKHLLDSLAIMPWVLGQHIIDVGTGAGLPGIPLAIVLPDKHFILLDSNGKKTRFLLEVKRQLHLKNVDIVQSRVECYQPSQGFDTIMSRAFSNLNQMVHWTNHLIAPQGIWLAMKGKVPDEELHTLHRSYCIEPYLVEGLEGERCCIIISNT